MRTPSTTSGSWTAGNSEKRDDSLGRVLDRAVEDLAAGHVHVPVVDLALAAGDAEAQVGLVADDPHLLGGVEALLDPLHLLALGVPVEKHGAEEEVLEVAEAHARRPGPAPEWGSGTSPTGRRARAGAAISGTRAPWRGSPSCCSCGRSTPSRVFSGAPTRIQASHSSSIATRSGERSAEQLHAARSRPRCLEGPESMPMKLSWTTGQALAPADRAARSPRSSGRASGLPTTTTCQPGWTSTHRSTSRSCVLLDAWISHVLPCYTPT